MCHRDSLWHEEYCLNNAIDRNLEVNFSYNKNLQNAHNFSKSIADIKLPRLAKYVERNRREKTICSHFEVAFLMWHVTVDKRPYAAISKLLSLTLWTVVAKLSPAIEKNWKKTNLLYFELVPPRTKKQILRIDLVHFCLKNIKISLKVVNFKWFWADTVIW